MTNPAIKKRPLFALLDRHAIRGAGWLLLLSLAIGGTACGKPKVTVDATPFEKAVAQYLRKNDMQMALKEIKEGPVITGETATMTASLTPVGLGSPRVTWQLRFEKRAGAWVVVSHQD